MKNKIKNDTDNFWEMVQAELKENLMMQNAFLFNINDRRIKVLFSDNHKAPTIESALVKIASNRGK